MLYLSFVFLFCFFYVFFKAPWWNAEQKKRARQQKNSRKEFINLSSFLVVTNFQIMKLNARTVPRSSYRNRQDRINKTPSDRTLIWTASTESLTRNLEIEILQICNPR